MIVQHDISEDFALGVATLSLEEENHLRKILQKAEQIEKTEVLRRRKLADSIDEEVNEVQQKEHSAGTLCESCSKRLVYWVIVFTRFVCGCCGLVMCKQCVIVFNQGSLILCQMCYKNVKLMGESGQWFSLASGRSEQSYNGPLSLKRFLDNYETFRSELHARALADSVAVKEKKGLQIFDNLAKHLKPKAKKVKQQTTISNSANEFSRPVLAIYGSCQIYEPQSSQENYASSKREDQMQRNSLLHAARSNEDLLSPLPGRHCSLQRNSLHSSLLDLSPSLRGSFTSLSSMSSSTGSIYTLDRCSTTSYPNKITGEIVLIYEYSKTSNEFSILLLQCFDLDNTRRSLPDIFVKFYLLPDQTKSSKRRSQTIKGNLNPIYNERIVYNISMEDLQSRVLWVSVWHQGRTLSRNDFYGEVYVNVEDINFEVPSWQNYQLQEKRNVSFPVPNILLYKGDLLLSIKYTPAATLGQFGQIDVIVESAKNLTAERLDGASNCFCKCYLLPDKQVNGKKKSVVAMQTLDPVWNCHLIFTGITVGKVEDHGLEISVWDYAGKLKSNEFLGGVKLNSGTGISNQKKAHWMNARGEEVVMWQSMINQPNTFITGILALRPNMN